MRIAISNPRSGWGGASTMALGLARGLCARGHEVVIVCKPGSPLHREAAGEFPCEPILYGIDFPPGAVSRVRRALRRHGTQVLLSSVRTDLRLTVLGAKTMGIPVAVRRVDIDPFSRLPHYRYFLDRLPDHWIANSAATREAMLRSAPWLRESQISTIHNGIELRPFEDAEPLDLGLPAGALTIGFVGRLQIEKGLPELAAAWTRAAPQLPRAHLVIAGTGEYEQELRRRLEDAPRVHWLGFRRDVPAVMTALDVVAMPSWNEPFGLVATEAMAAGRPVIATRAGGLAEVVVDEGTGVLIPPRDAPALAAAMVRLAGDAVLRDRLGRAGRRHVREHFSSERVVEEYEQTLQRLVERRDPGTD